MNRIFMIMSITVFLMSCSHNKSVLDVLSKNGFDSNHPLMCGISDGHVTKNANRDVIKWLDTTKQALLIDKISEPPSYTVFLLSGSSFESQQITIRIGRSGEGSVEYMGKIIAHFKSPSVYEATLNSFNGSDIIIK